jgi:hypothetical protein
MQISQNTEVAKIYSSLSFFINTLKFFQQKTHLKFFTNKNDSNNYKLLCRFHFTTKDLPQNKFINRNSTQHPILISRLKERPSASLFT